MENKLSKGLNTYQIKVLALIIMTLDHIAVYLAAIPFINTASGLIRIVGRIAAPLFLFMIVQGLRHTRNKEKYALRLYIASLAMAVGNILIGIVPSEMQFMSPRGNIFTTFFYVVFYVMLIEKIIQAVKERDLKKVIAPVILILATFAFVGIEIFVYNLTDVSGKFRNILIDGIGTLLPNPFGVDYSFTFILLGIAWYFIGNKRIECALFAALCMATYLFQGAISVSYHFRFFELFVPNQFWMFLALPFIYLYNNEKGKSNKYFFYMYYPLHIYVLYIIGSILMIT